MLKNNKLSLLTSIFVWAFDFLWASSPMFVLDRFMSRSFEVFLFYFFMFSLIFVLGFLFYFGSFVEKPKPLFSTHLNHQGLNQTAHLNLQLLAQMQTPLTFNLGPIEPY